MAVAKRPFFGAAKQHGCAFVEESIEFEWHSGLSWQVRQRSSKSMADAIVSRYGNAGLSRGDILEVSTASDDFETGKALSAFNLMCEDPATGRMHSMENWFQSAKVFAKGGAEYGPYNELLTVKTPKHYLNSSLGKGTIEKYVGDRLFERIQSEIRGAELVRFELWGRTYPLVPRSCFYDYLYVTALRQPQNHELARRLCKYRVFTDVMFNPGTGKNRKYNTQARSCAIFVSLEKRGLIDEALRDIDAFIETVGYPVGDASTDESPGRARHRLSSAGESTGFARAPRLYTARDHRDGIEASREAVAGSPTDADSVRREYEHMLDVLEGYFLEAYRREYLPADSGALVPLRTTDYWLGYVMEDGRISDADDYLSSMGIERDEANSAMVSFADASTLSQKQWVYVSSIMNGGHDGLFDHARSYLLDASVKHHRDGKWIVRRQEVVDRLLELEDRFISLACLNVSLPANAADLHLDVVEEMLLDVAEKVNADMDHDEGEIRDIEMVASLIEREIGKAEASINCFDRKEIEVALRGNSLIGADSDAGA